jgi:hypothetical protein
LVSVHPPRRGHVWIIPLNFSPIISDVWTIIRYYFYINYKTNCGLINVTNPLNLISYWFDNIVLQ